VDDMRANNNEACKSAMQYGYHNIVTFLSSI